MPPAVEAFVDILRGGRGYTRSDRQQMAVRRQSLEEHILDPSVSATARQQYEEERDRIDRALSPAWPSPVAGVPVDVFEDAWMRRFGILWLCVALVTLWKAWQRRHQIARLARRLRGAEGLSATSESSALGTVSAPYDDLLESEQPIAVPLVSMAEAEGDYVPESAPQQIEFTAAEVAQLSLAELHRLDQETVAAIGVLSEIVIPATLTRRIEAIVVNGVPGVRFDGNTDLFYPLTSPLRRAFFSILACADKPLRMTEIMNLLPRGMDRSYRTGRPIWKEGEQRVVSKIVTHRIIRQTDKRGPWVLDLTSVPTPHSPEATPGGDDAPAD